MATPIIWREITTVFKGRVVRGSYAVEDATVKVKTADGEKATQLKGTNAIWAAGRLLRELAAEGKGYAKSFQLSVVSYQFSVQDKTFAPATSYSDKRLRPIMFS